MQPVSVDVKVYKKSKGADYFVRFKCGDREITPYMFQERWKAEYSVHEFKHFFGLCDTKPEFRDYTEETHPNLY
jgi:hypothetical protein